jgi:hypothetical protein
MSTLDELSIAYNFIDLGFTDLTNQMSETAKTILNTKLKASELEILVNHNA